MSLKFSKTVDSKPKVIDKYNNEIRDLSAKSLKDLDFDFVDITLCPEDFAMRPDLLAELKLGDQSKMEILLKSNEISNPFSLEPGDVILIADPIESKEKFITMEPADDPRAKVRKQYVDPSKKVMKEVGDSYEKYKEREKKKLPPNYSKENDKEMQFTDGQIILGPHVSKKVDKSKDIPLSKQKLIDKLKNNE